MSVDKMYTMNAPFKPAVKAKYVEKCTFSAKEATVKNKRGKNAEQASSRALSRIRLLIFLSTLLSQNQRRICHRTLLICLENKKFCAYRKLGRLFLVPSMTSYTTWASRRRQMTGSHTGSKVELTWPGSPTALRLEQKMSGLFDTVNAGNGPVAGKASNPGLDGMEVPAELSSACLPGFGTGEELGVILPGMDEMGFLGEGDFLDSFMDLSNFLAQENSRGLPTVVQTPDVTDEKLDFSGLLSSISDQAAVSMEPTATPQPPTLPLTSLRKRKRVAYSEIEDQDSECVVDDGMGGGVAMETPVPDHDYITKSKKPRLGSLQCDALAAADVISTALAESSACGTSAPKSDRRGGKPVDKYRERRDKNNEASRRSRQIRKQKFVEMDKEASELEAHNEELRAKIVELEALAKTMKAMLIEKMTTK